MSKRLTFRNFQGGATLVVACLLVATSSGATSVPESKAPGSGGLVIELVATEADVLEAVKAVAADPILRGTYIYDKEQTLTGAMPADSSADFEPWTEPGHVFYKVLRGAVAPRHFKDSNDMGTITVRYVIQGEGARTRLRIDAVFAQQGRPHAHASDGTVETSEFGEIQDRLGKIQWTERHTAEILAAQQEEAMKGTLLREKQGERTRLDNASSSVRTLEQRVISLRHDVELRTKDDGTELKSAPFHSSAKLRSLPAGTEVLILVITPYWYGVETKDAQRGWLRRDQVVPLP